VIPAHPRVPAAAFLALVRHARALRAQAGEADGERALSPEGRAEFALQIERLGSMGFGCDELWTSPLRRALETAELLGASCGFSPVPHEGLCSDPESRACTELLAMAQERALASRVVLVGHQPWLAQIARGLGAHEVQEIECGEVLWLVPRGPDTWSVAARLYPG